MSNLHQFSILHRATSKAENLIVTELSKLFDKCSIKELKVNDNKSAVIQQVSAQIATISYDKKEFIDETPADKIGNSLEDLDDTIINA